MNRWCVSQSLPVAILAVTWMSFTSIIVMFPATPKTSPDEMNYTIVVLGAVLGLALAYYVFPKYGGRYWFRGPIKNIDAAMLRALEDKAGTKIESEDIDLTVEKPSTDYL